MAYNQGIPQDPSTAAAAAGSTVTANVGRSNEQLVSELYGKYYYQAYYGNVFYASTVTAGVVIPISSSLTPTYSVWNPAGSGKNLVPIATLIGWTATSAALGSFIWMATTNAGANISSTAPFVAFGTGSAVNANLGSGKVSSMRIGSGGTTTLVAAPTVYRETGMSITATTAATATGPGWVWRDDWDGTGIVGPGNAIHLMGTTAIAVAATVTLVYLEIPI